MGGLPLDKGCTRLNQEDDQGITLGVHLEVSENDCLFSAQRFGSHVPSADDTPHSAHLAIYGSTFSSTPQEQVSHQVELCV